jgi:hypothetical protein
MSPEKQRIAIAEACGWKREDKLPFTRHGGTVEQNVPEEAWWHDKVAGCNFAPPNYLSDLNAMHEAEKTLTVLKREYYAQQLFELLDVPITCFNSNHIKMWVLLRATASQRAEAFLRTLNLWQDDET